MKASQVQLHVREHQTRGENASSNYVRDQNRNGFTKEERDEQYALLAQKIQLGVGIWRILKKEKLVKIL